MDGGPTQTLHTQAANCTKDNNRQTELYKMKEILFFKVRFTVFIHGSDVVGQHNFFTIFNIFRTAKFNFTSKQGSPNRHNNLVYSQQ